ncbi:DUF3375 domain-containing protein [Anaerolineales bacterium HSG25]|nr:DUF3375 domain-containing protein [Anaerolineales bacterium HSG25]
MDHDQLKVILKNAPSIKLLRSDNAPLIISFLDLEFKQKQQLTIPLTFLSERLDDYLELLRDGRPGLYPSDPEKYLNEWCDAGWLRKYFLDDDDPVFELTPDTEKTLGWVQLLQAQNHQFIGTESRFLRIFDLLKEIDNRSTIDVEVRLAQLETQKAEIQAEINHITTTGEVEAFTQTQLKERFNEANEESRRLISDFRGIEQNFRDITRQIQERQLMAGTRKGKLVEYVLDADDELKESDQGRSFYAFWEFLMSPQRQDNLRDLLETVYNLPELQEVTTQAPVLRRIKTSLIQAGEKIVQSNHRLAEQLRRMLDERQLAESRRVQALMTDIKQLALVNIDQPPTERGWITLDGNPAINLSMERPLWKPTEIPHFDQSDLQLGDDETLSIDNPDLLYNPFYVDRATLKQQINRILLRQPQVTLAELTGHYPLEKGLSELVTYFALASQEAKHTIDESAIEEIIIPVDEGEVRLTVPRVMFRR